MVYSTMEENSSDISQLRHRVDGIHLNEPSPNPELNASSLSITASSMVQQDESCDSTVFHAPPVPPMLPAYQYASSAVTAAASESRPTQGKDGNFVVRSTGSGDRTVVPEHPDSYPPAQRQRPRGVVEMLSQNSAQASIPRVTDEDLFEDVVPGAPQQETDQSAAQAAQAREAASQFNIQTRTQQQQEAYEAEVAHLTKEELLKKGDPDEAIDPRPRRPQQATTNHTATHMPHYEIHHGAAAGRGGIPGGPNTYAMGGGNIHVYNFGNVKSVQIGGTVGQGQPVRPKKNVYGPSTQVHPKRKKSPSSTSCSTGATRTKRLLVPRRPIRTDDLDFVADHVGKNWRHLGRKLGFSSGQLDIFENDYQGLHEQIFAMLDKWVSTVESMSIKQLVKYLVEAGCVDVATRLADRELEGNCDDGNSSPP